MQRLGTGDVSFHGLAFGPAPIIVGAASFYYYFRFMTQSSKLKDSVGFSILGLAPTICVVLAYFVGIRDRSDMTIYIIVLLVIATSIISFTLAAIFSAVTGYSFPGSWRKPLKRSDRLLWKGLAGTTLGFATFLGVIWLLGDARLQDATCYLGTCSIGSVMVGSNLRASGGLWVDCLVFGNAVTAIIVLAFNALRRMYSKIR